MGKPQVGDLVRVVRTRTEVFEGRWVEADPDVSGNHAIERADGVWMRVRDQGPITFGCLPEDGYTESDVIEVIEVGSDAFA